MLDTGFRLALSPLLIAQALKVRRIAQSLPEPTGPREGIAGSGPPLHLAIVGDSSAAGVGVAHQAQALSGQLVDHLAADNTVHWHLHAKTGATTRSTLKTLSDQPPRPCDVVVVALGVNDVTRLLPAKTWVRQQQRLITRLRQLHDPARIYLSAMPPIDQFPLLPEPLRWTLGRHARKLEARRVAWITREPNLTRLPFDLPLDPAFSASDGFHPSAKLYALWAEALAAQIRLDRTP